MKLLFCIIMFIVPGLVKFVAYSQVFMVAELNTENMFDFMHNSLKNDYEFTPDGQRRWTKSKYWKKINSRKWMKWSSSTKSKPTPTLVIVATILGRVINRD